MPTESQSIAFSPNSPTTGRTVHPSSASATNASALMLVSPKSQEVMDEQEEEEELRHSEDSAEEVYDEEFEMNNDENQLVAHNSTDASHIVKESQSSSLKQQQHRANVLILCDPPAGENHRVRRKSLVSSVLPSPQSSRPRRIFKLRTDTTEPLKLQVSRSINTVRLTNSTNRIGAFYAGSCFQGIQRSSRQDYGVTVEIKHVDLANSSACGYIRIKGLTDEFEELTTCFDAELIGSRHNFLTRKWEADENVDRLHWTKFPGFQSYEDCFNNNNNDAQLKSFLQSSADTTLTSYPGWQNQPFVFMRWKEHFLVPDHRVTTVNGASFAGFYYICFEVLTGSICGFYYHQNSEWFQQLTLRHVAENSFSSFDFR